MPKKLRPAVDLMAFKCRTLKVKRYVYDTNLTECIERNPYKMHSLNTHS
jgi:hypothetical protein